MSLIRPLEPEDLPGAKALVSRAFPPSRHEAGQSGADFLEHTLLASPWNDPELPSLVALEGNRVTGFLALHPRRMRLDDRTLRVVCCSHFVVDAEHRGGAAGALLLGRCLQGPQDLTISDTATDVVARVWSTYGGHVDAARSCEWMHVLRPGRLVTRLARQWVAGTRPDRNDLPVPGLPLHVAGRLVPMLRVPDDPLVEGETITPTQAIAEIPFVTRKLRLRADYDESYLSWLVDRLRCTLGEVILRSVRRGGRALGWYIYVLRPTGVGRVLQVLAAPRHSEAVVSELLADARSRGAALLSGRLEPHLYEPLRRRHTAIGFAERHVVHSRHSDVLEAHATPPAVVSRLDGEWW